MARSGRSFGPWPASVAARLHFERGARALHPTLRGGPGRGSHGGGFRYRVLLELVFYEPRVITIIFDPGKLRPVVFADGPPASPHRYDDGGLCMWHPMDPAAQRWCFGDGLVDLLDTIRAHLLREAIWRETGDWPGDEVPHGAIAISENDNIEEAA